MIELSGRGQLAGADDCVYSKHFVASMSHAMNNSRCLWCIQDDQALAT